MNRIKELRIESGLSQEALGKIFNCSFATIGRYERGDREIDSETICRMCDIFHCSADYLLCRTDVRRQEMTERQHQILDAYEAASPYSRGMVDAALAPYIKQEKSAVS